MSVYVFIFYLDTDFFWATEEYRKCVRHELLTAQRKGCEARMRKPAGILSVSLRRDLVSLPLWGFCFYFCLFFLQTTFLFSQCTGGKGGSGQVPCREWPELLNSQERRSDWPLWVSGLWMFLERFQRMGIVDCSNFKSVWVMGLVLYSPQTAFLKH